MQNAHTKQKIMKWEIFSFQFFHPSFPQNLNVGIVLFHHKVITKIKENHKFVSENFSEVNFRTKQQNNKISLVPKYLIVTLQSATFYLPHPLQ